MKRFLLILLTAIISVAASSKTIWEVSLDKYSLSVQTHPDGIMNVDSIVITSGILHEYDFETIRRMVLEGRLTGINMEKASVSNATIPDNIFSAPSGSRSNLQYISLCRSIRFIGANAFANSSLRMIELPNGIISIGRNAFADCTELKEISISRMSFHAENIFGDKYPEILNVPVNARGNYQNDACWEGISEIREKKGLFNTLSVVAGGDKTLEQMLGEAMLTTDSLVFKGFVSAADYNTICKAIAIGRLCSVDMSDCDVEDGKVLGATYSSEVSRYNSRSLRYFRFPKNTTSIKGSFKHAYLFDFNIPSTVKELSGRLFEWCTLADKLVIPEGVEKIGKEVFLDAIFPHDIVLPSTLCEVGEGSLQLMEMPDKLLNVYFNRMYPPANGESSEEGPFGNWNGCMPDCWTLYVPVGAKKYFAADKYWGCFPNIVETPELDGGTSAIGGVMTEDAAADKEQRIYTLDGRYVGKDMDRLGKGVYVVGGRKVVR